MSDPYNTFNGLRVIIKDGHDQPFHPMASRLASPRYAPRNWFTWKAYSDTEALVGPTFVQMTSRAYRCLKDHIA